MSSEVSGARVLQVEGMTSTKALRQDCAWYILKTVRSSMWLEQNGLGEKQKAGNTQPGEAVVSGEVGSS